MDKHRKALVETGCKVYRETALAWEPTQLGLLGVSTCLSRLFVFVTYTLLSTFNYHRMILNSLTCSSVEVIVVTNSFVFVSSFVESLCIKSYKNIIFVVGGFMEELQEPKLKSY